MALVEKGRLLLGLPYQGKLYFEVEARVLTIGQECEVLELIESLEREQESEKNSDKTQAMLRELAYLSAQIEVQGVPREALSPRYLLEHLATDDYEILLELIGNVRKKRIAVGDTPNHSEQTADV